MSEYDHSLRDHLLELLKAGSAHLGFDEAIEGLPPELRGKKVPSLSSHRTPIILP